MQLILRRRTLLIAITVWLWAIHTIFAQTPSWNWANAVRSDLGADYNKDIAVDNQGNVYVTGNMNEGVNGAGADRAFVRKYNSGGTLLWQKTISNVFTIHAMNSSSIAVNSTGTEVYITGIFSGKMAFSNTTSLDAGSSFSVFLAKYSTTNGDLQWVRSGSSSGSFYDNPLLELDELGNVYLTGAFDGDLQFGGVSLVNGFDFKAIYLAKYTNSGNPLSAQRVAYIEYIADDNDVNLNDFEVDGSGNTYYVGDFRGTLNLNGTFVNSAGGGSDIFVLRNATNGNAMWRRQYSGGLANLNGIDRGLVLKLDNLGNIIFGGYFTASLAIGNTNLQANVNSVSGFLAKLNSSGTPIWAIKPTDRSSTVKTLAVAGGDNIYVGSEFSGTTTFGNTNLEAANGDFYIAKFNANGQAQWGIQANPNINSPFSDMQIAVNQALIDQVYAAGSFGGSAIFGAFVLNSSTDDTYIAKFNLSTSVCQEPLQLSVANITSNSAQVIWEYPTSALQIEMRYRKAGDATWQSQTFGLNTSTTNISNLLASSQYEVQVRSLCNNNQLSNWTSSVNFTTATPTEPCIAPNGLIISQITSTSAALSWARPNFAATQYDIRYRKSNESIWTNIGVSGFNTELNALQPLTNYIVQIRSHCGNGINSTYSTDYQFTTLATTVCNIPQNLVVASQTPNFSQITWQSAGNGVVYEVRYKLVIHSIWTTVSTNTNSIQIAPVFSGMAYQIQVRSKCSNTLFSNWSSVLNFVTVGLPACGTPSGIIVQNITNNSANVVWVNGRGANGYLVRYKTIAETVWKTVNTSTLQINLTNLLSGTIYQVQIQSLCNDGLVSSFSRVVSFTTNGTTACAIPSSFTFDALSNNTARLLWGSTNGAIGYEIRYRSVLTSTWTTVSISNGSFISHELAGLLSGTQYYAQIRALCTNSAVSEFSNLISFTTLGNTTCAIPIGLNASSISNQSAVLTWATAAGAQAYEIRYRSILSPLWTSLRVNEGNTISQIIANLLSGTIYYAQIRTLCSSGLVTNYSPEISFVTLGTAICPLPTGLTVSNIGNTNATFAWDMNTATSFEVRYRPETSNSWTITNVVGNSLLVNNLLSGTRYIVIMRAICGTNLSTVFTSSITFSTTGASACAIPTNLAISGMTNTTASLTWATANGALQYEVFYRPEFSNRWIILLANSNQVVLSNLLSGTQYFVFVRSRCSVSLNSLNSSPISFFTTGTPFCGNVSNLQVGNLTSNTANITWTNSSGANAYEVQYKLPTALVYTTLIVNTNSTNLNNLIAGSTYQIRVRALCNDNYASAYLNATFTTVRALAALSQTEAAASQALDNQELTINKPMQIYPNPSKGLVNVVKGLAKDRIGQIQVLDKLGNVVFKSEQKGDIHTELNLQHLPKGIYYLKLISTEKSEIQRIIIE
ncbi:MAG: fibronectin type III domain-containing protein [Microscillaceae bacterium]|jgi:hypothetical protein|nr:fibronectin type III domain-containing protein [Microscillaceae bacterium]